MIRTLVPVLLLTACAPAIAATPPGLAEPIQKPITSVTPGETFPGVTAAMVCSGDWATAHRKELTRAQKVAVLRAYGLPAGTKVAEWDHLVSLSDAGDNSIRNIWPQLYPDQKRRKDTLEDKVHAAVCSGRLTMAQGQHEVADFWLYW